MLAALPDAAGTDLTQDLSAFEEFVSGKILVWVLLGAGLYLTIRTRGVQVRLFPRAVHLVARSRHQRGSLSSFQAFVIGLGGRVGTGNIAGVALAVTLGGPGALFWMWVVALLGMATSFAESTLAQVFKVRSADGIFRGGPAYYMQRGLGLRGGSGLSRLGRIMGVVFAAIVLLACLTTSVGLLSAWGQFSNDLWPRVSFTREVLAAALVSLVLANLGLAAILTVVSPLTLLLYPITITLVLVTLVDVVAPGHLRAAYRWGVVCSTALGLVSALSDLGWTAPSRLLARTGLWNDQTGWILPTAVFAVVGLVIDVVAGRLFLSVRGQPRGSCRARCF